jgi:hypothetical protein
LSSVEFAACIVVVASGRGSVVSSVVVGSVVASGIEDSILAKSFA